MQLTDKQARAIYQLDKNLLVSASAGSGKTFVLVQRIIELIVRQKLSIDQFLVVTFTNAAAVEMRERFEEALYLAAKQHPTEAPFILRQIQKLHRAQISTLHAFCKRIILENFTAIDVNPKVTIASQQLLQIISQRALDEVFDEHYALQTPAFHGLLARYASHRNDDALREYIVQIHTFSRAQPYPQQWLAEVSERFQEMDEQHPLIESICLYAHEMLRHYRAILDEAIALCQEMAGPIKYQASLLATRSQLAMSDQSAPDFESIRQLLARISFEKLPSITKKDAVDRAVQEEVKALRNTVKNGLAALRDRFFNLPLADKLRDIEETAEQHSALIALVNDYAERYQQLKVDESVIDFNDLEQLAIKALNQAAIAAYYRKKISHIFIDEYQDSNRVQEEIISLIKRPNNLFLVGDVKQSIYGFRMAEPTLFLEKFSSYQTEPSSERIDLNDNFRSHPDILNAINQIFDRLMTPNFGSLDYRQTGRLNSLRTDFKGDAMARLTIIDGQGRPAEQSKQEYEAFVIAKRIKVLAKREIYDVKEMRWRRISYADIVILLRSAAGRAIVLRDVLTQCGIPVVLDEEDNYFKLIEVATIINILKVIDNSYQDLALLAVMRSFIGGFSDEMLAQISCYKDGYLISALEQYSQMENDLLAAKIKDFLAMLDDFRRRRHLPLSDFIWLILDVTGYYQFIKGLEDGEARSRHVLALIEKAEVFERERQSGLHHFVAYLELLSRAEINYGGRARQDEVKNAVQVMTIHKAKGLQFPVVILASADKKFNQLDSQKPIILHRQLGLVSQWIDPEHHLKRSTLSRQYAALRIKRDTLEEEMRLLYVALTRAIYHLEIVGQTQSLNKKSQKWQRPFSAFQLMEQSNYLDWLAYILVDNATEISRETVLKNGWLIAQECPAQSCAGQMQNQLGKRWIEKLQAVAQQPFVIFDGQTSSLPAKLSVTALKTRALSNFQPLEPVLVSAFDDANETAIRRGNLYHKLFEEMPFKRENAMTAIDKHLDALAEEARAMLDEQLIRRFATSQLYRRIASAQQIWREQPFVYKKKYKSDTILVQGMIDLLFLEGDKLVLVDYKSDRVSDVALLKARYTEQLTLYAEAIAKTLGRAVSEKLIYSIYLSETIEL